MRALLLGVFACSGHGGGGGSPDAPTAPPLTADDLALACENAYGCLAPPVDGPTIPKCLGDLFDGDTLVSLARPAQIRCLAAAGGDCTKARACLGFTVESCSTAVDECHGDTLYSCSGGFALDLDCRGGTWFTDDSTCVTGTSPACGLGACPGGSSTTTSCDGTRVVACQPNGVRVPFDCAAFFGETCASDGTSATCVGTGAACSVSRCDGTTMVRCDGSREQRVDCGTMLDGGTCVPTGSNGVSCGFASACTASATCDGTTASLCILGATVNVDCIAAGFASCTLGSCVPAQFP